MENTNNHHEMGQTMRACVLYDVARMDVRDVPRSQGGRRDVVVRVKSVGLCGTDIHIFAGHANYNTDAHGQPIPFAQEPQILGHEISGEVVEVGADVTDLRTGDRVVIDQGLNCVSMARSPHCEYCDTGDSHQCEFYREHGITGLPGGLAEFIAVPAVNCVRIQSSLGAEAAMTEPLGCIIHSSDFVAKARSRYAINAGDKERRVRAALICGVGPAGLLFTQYLRQALGFEGMLLVSEPNPTKRALAERFGAQTIDPTASDVVERVQELTGGRGVEYLIEATGSGRVMATIPGLIRKQATVLLYGHGHAGTDMSLLNNVLFREPVLIASVGASGGFDPEGRPEVYRRALLLIERGSIDVASIITHRYTRLEQVPQALADDWRAADYVKGVVTL
ncbi:MAG TPA: alcohol dehydrogenase catalytic domain-containing protein [Blastocatellia bacterium]|nr:alcohol dehydrogenase catalytic domain-containing protein [Blastocatellia bacterium]